MLQHSKYWASLIASRQSAACFFRPMIPAAAVSSSAAERKPKTGILMVNMGGPSTLDGVESFLRNLFSDRELINLPFQDYLGPLIAKRRAPRIQEQYAKIGGGSPILRWTDLQGKAMCESLDQISPETGPHKHYIAFRYVPPFTDEAIQKIIDDGVERLVVFSQYPQWSCTTTGSSLNELTRYFQKHNLRNQFKLSIIDRWFQEPEFISSVCKKILQGFSQFPDDKSRDDAIIVFSAHSLPVSVVDKGDSYTHEVSTTCHLVMNELGLKNKFIVAWQSQVGPKKWVEPQTQAVIENLAKRGEKNLLVVPIAFTSDHIETLFELDLEYGHVAKQAGIANYIRAPAMNDDPDFAKAQAAIVARHLQSNSPCSSQYGMRCQACTNPICRTLLDKY